MTETAPLTLTYTNWRGETRERQIIPVRVWHGATQWHPKPQWLLEAIDTETGEQRDFAFSGIGACLTHAGTVTVKQIEWVALSRREGDLVSVTEVGEYMIRPSTSGRFRLGSSKVSGWVIHDTVDDAKAAAQADYEVRILSALKQSAPPDTDTSPCR